MNNKYLLVQQIGHAKKDSAAADQLIEQYLPFIRSEAAKFMKRIPVEGQDDELSIAMFAFYEAILAYQPSKGAFLHLAALAIRNRLIDFCRREQRHQGILSLDASDSQEDSPSALLEKLEDPKDAIGELEHRRSTKQEISVFSQELASFGLSLSQVADSCPKQERTLCACMKALEYAKKHPSLLEQMVQKKKLPLRQLCEGAGVERKTLERHRDYMIAILLAYTNGFELIRGHLRQIQGKEEPRV